MLSVQAVASIPAVEDLRPIWKTWSHSLDTDLDYFVHNLKNDSTIQRPHVITVWKDGSAAGDACGARQRVQGFDRCLIREHLWPQGEGVGGDNRR